MKGLSSPAKAWQSSSHAVSLERSFIYLSLKKLDLCYWLLDCKGLNRIPLSFQPFLLIPSSFHYRYFQYLWKLPTALGAFYSPLPFLGISGSSRLKAEVTGLGADLSACGVNPWLSPLGFPYIHTDLSEKLWSSVVAKHLPQPCYDSNTETSAILWAQPNLSLPSTFSCFMKA